MSKEKPMVSAGNSPQVRYSAAYLHGCARAAGVGLPERSEPEGPQGAARERIGDMDESNPILSTATLSNDGGFSIFKFGGDTIRFATSPRLVRYIRVKRWEDGYLEVDADYGNGEVEDYIDIRHILDNLYYDTDDFLKGITKVEVCYE